MLEREPETGTGLDRLRVKAELRMKPKRIQTPTGRKLKRGGPSNGEETQTGRKLKRGGNSNGEETQTGRKLKRSIGTAGYARKILRRELYGEIGR